MKLNKTSIDALTCPPGRKDVMVTDDELTGFAVRVTRDGTKTFLLQYRRGQLTRRMTIGKYGEITPAQARSRAEVLRGIVAAGGDPVADRRAELAAEAAAAAERKRAAKADILTFGKLIDQWDELQLQHRRERYRAEATRALRFNLAELLELPAHSIDAEAARRAVDRIVKTRKTPAEPQSGAKITPPPAIFTGATMARRVRAYGHAAYAWGIKRSLVGHNPFAEVAMEGREIERERVLTDAELADIWTACGLLGWPWGPFFRFLLLTLQREAETAGMLWSELSPGLGLWTLPGARTKNAKSHLVHLAEPARAILAAAPRLSGAALVFTTTGVTPVSGFSHAKLRLDAKIAELRSKRAEAEGIDPADLVPWRLHDFRRTGVTVLARLGVRWEVADKILNHIAGAIKGVAAIYQRHEFLAEREAALDAWAAHIVALGNAGKNKKAP